MKKTNLDISKCFIYEAVKCTFCQKYQAIMNKCVNFFKKKKALLVSQIWDSVISINVVCSFDNLCHKS